MCDIQLQNVITSSYDVQFGCSKTVWKAHLVNFTSGCFGGKWVLEPTGKEHSGR